MDMLNDLLGGKRNEYDDFVNRYDQGAPWDGINDDEALSRYREVAPQLSDDDYRSSAEQAFSRLSPQQRMEFGRWLQTQSPHGSSYGFDNGSLDDPGILAGATTRMRQQNPGMLDGLLGGMLGGGGGAMGGMGGGMMGGGGGSGMSSGGMSGMLGNPIGKAVLAGVAAMAARKMMGR